MISMQKYYKASKMLKYAEKNNNIDEENKGFR